MPEYLSPGVYVEEIDAGPKPIEGVSTSTAGTVGVTARGPDTGKPVLVTSFGEYVRTFGGPVPVDDVTKARWSDDPEKGEFWTFPLAVKGFFDNGGQRLYVRRVVSKGAAASTIALGQGVMTFVTRNALDNTNVLVLENLIGIENGTVLVLTSEGVSQDVTVSSYDGTTNAVTLTTNLTKRIQANRDFVQVKQTAAQGPSIQVTAKSKGGWGNALQVRSQPMDAGAFTLMADPTLGAAATTVITAVAAPAGDTFDVASTNNINTGDILLIDGKQYRVKTVAAPKITVDLPLGNPTWKKDWVVIKGLDPNGTTKTTIAADKTGDNFDVVSATGFTSPELVLVNGVPYRATITGTNFKIERVVAWKTGWSVVKVRVAAQLTNATTTPSLFVWGASSLYKNAFVEIEDGKNGKKYYGQITAIAGSKVTIALPAAPSSSFDLLEGQRIRLIEAKFDVLFAPKDGPSATETIRNVRFAEAETGDPMFVSRRVGAESHYIDASVTTQPGSLLQFAMAAQDASTSPQSAARWAVLASGDDDFGSLDPDAFVGENLGPGKRSGIQALEDIDDIAITMVPSIWASLVQNALIQQAELLKYRFAILDPRPVKETDDDVIGEIQAFRSGFDTKYAALYFPRIEVRDPFADTTVGLGPSGHLAGIYARIDVERGVHKAPANEVILGIDTANGFHGLEVEITKREQDLLNPRGINALRFFPNRGTRVWGARTLSSDGSWRYINVRRIFIFVEHSIDIGTQWVVFEPNEEKTWARVRQSISNFLNTVWRSGALFGTKAEEAFFVRCDRTTMTQDDIDNGRLITVIGIAPVKPAEFVIFRIQQKLIDQKEP
jgi:phage tail sheath protein FI